MILQILDTHDDCFWFLFCLLFYSYNTVVVVVVIVVVVAGTVVLLFSARSIEIELRESIKKQTRKIPPLLGQGHTCVKQFAAPLGFPLVPNCGFRSVGQLTGY